MEDYNKILLIMILVFLISLLIFNVFNISGNVPKISTIIDSEALKENSIGEIDKENFLKTSLKVPSCGDELDNDLDGLIDYPDDKGCISSEDEFETNNIECNNGMDDDKDSLIDYPNDPDCTFYDDKNE